MCYLRTSCPPHLPHGLLPQQSFLSTPRAYNMNNRVDPLDLSMFPHLFPSPLSTLTLLPVQRHLGPLCLLPVEQLAGPVQGAIVMLADFRPCRSAEHPRSQHLLLQTIKAGCMHASFEILIHSMQAYFPTYTSFGLPLWFIASLSKLSVQYLNRSNTCTFI